MTWRYRFTNTDSHDHSWVEVYHPTNRYSDWRWDGIGQMKVKVMVNRTRWPE